MNQDWQEFIESTGAEIGADDTVHFAAAPALPDCALADLSHLGLIRLSGEDKQTFLQGQVTNDVRQVTAEHSQLNSLCSPKGRMMANFLLFERDGDLFLQLPKARLEPILKRLQMYVLRAKVTLSDASDELVRIGIAGDCASHTLPELPPDTAGASLQIGELTVLRLPGDRPRFEIIGTAAAVRDIWEQSSGSPANADFWPLMDIRAGIPSIYDETAEAFIPQMVNMQLIDGVSFTKGCYTGQEIVARMQYLGKLKRRMYRAHIKTETPPLAGDDLYSPDSASGQGAGRVVDVRPSPDGGYELLVVAEIAVAEESTLLLGDSNGPALALSTPPYEFEVPES